MRLTPSPQPARGQLCGRWPHSYLSKCCAALARAQFSVIFVIYFAVLKIEDEGSRARGKHYHYLRPRPALFALDSQLFDVNKTEPQIREKHECISRAAQILGLSVTPRF